MDYYYNYKGRLFEKQKMESANTNSSQSDELPECFEFVSLSHECRMKESYLKNTETEIAKLENEVEKLRLEKKWCFNEDGERVIPSTEDQATKICEGILTDQDLVEDVVKALRMKKLDLQINIKMLKEKCETLKREIR